MAYKETRVDIVFNADTKKAKAAMQDLQGSLNALMKANLDFNLGESVTKEVKESQQALLQLSQSLKNATNVDTGKLDLSRFKEQMDAGGMSIKKYYDVLTNMGPAGEQAFSKLALQIQKAEIPLKRTGKLANELWTTLKNTARWQLSASLLQGFTGAIQKAFRYSQDLNKSLNDIRIVTGASVEDMSRFAIEANKSAKALSATTNEYAKASLIYFQQGLSDAEVKERTDVTIKMANVSRESAEVVSDQMTAVWNNFADGSRTLEYYADVMTALGAATASSTAEITTGLEKFAAVAETVGLSYEYATTALATITDTTRQSADVVGNALKTLFARIQGLSLGETLEDGTDLTKYSEALMKVGISIKEQDGSLREMDDILDDMASKWQTLGKDQQVALAQTVAGVRQYTQLVALMDNWDKFEMNLEVAEGAEGALQEQADIYAESWEAARDRATTALEAIYEKLLDDEFLVDLIDGFTGFVGLVDNLIDGLGGLPGVLALVGTGFTKIFNKQMATSLNNMIYSVKMMTQKGRDSVTNEKVATAEFLKSMANKTGNPASAGAAQAYNEQGEAMKDFLVIQEQLSDEQREQYQLLLDMQSTYVEKVAVGTRELENLTAANEQLGKTAQSVAKRVFSTKERGNKTRAQVYERAYQSQATGVQAEAALKLVVPTSDITKLKTDIKKALDGIEFKGGGQAEKALQELEKLLQKDEVSAEELQKAIAQVSAGITGDFEDMRKAASGAGDGVEELEQATNELIQAQTRARGVADGVAKDLYGVHRAGEIASETYGKLGKRVLDTGTKMTYMASIASTAVMTISSLQGIGDVIRDDDLSDWDKFISILTTATFVVPNLIDSFNKLKELGAITKIVNGVSKAFTFLVSGPAGWLVGILSILAVVVGVKLVQAWKKWKDQQPEAQLERTKKEAERLKDALEEASQAADDLRNALDGYENTQDVLANCTKGTKEWADALRDANQEVLDLVDKYPELEGFLGTDNDGRLYLKSGYEDVIDQYENRENAIRAASVVTNKKQNDLENQITEDALIEGLYSYNGTSYNGIGSQGYDIVKNVLSANSGATTDDVIAALKEKGYVEGKDAYASPRMGEEMEGHDSNYAYFDREDIEALISSIKELTGEIEQDAAIAKANQKEYARATLQDNKKIQESSAKDYIELLAGQALPDVIDQVSKEKDSATVFQEYQKQFGNFESGARQDANGNVVDKDGNIISTLGEMVAKLYADEIQSAIEAKGDEYYRLYSGGRGEATAAATWKATGDVGKLTKSEIDAFEENPALSEGLGEAFEQQFNNIDPKVFAPGFEGLEYGLAANLQKLFGSENSGAIGAIIGKLGDQGAQIINQMDWSNWDSADYLQSALEDAGLATRLSTEEFDFLTSSLLDSNDAVKALDLNKFKQGIYDIKEIIGELEKGDTISSEDYAKLSEAEREYFTLTSDGTYMLTQDAKEFYDTVMGNRLDDAKERITQLQGDINEFDKAYDKYSEYIANNDGEDLKGWQATNILLAAGQYESGMTDEERIAKVKELTSAYEDNKLKLNEVQAILASMAEDETTLNKWLDEGRIDAEEYDGAMEVLRINQEKALKALNANVKGLEKSAPKITKALEAMNKGLDVKSPAFIEAINEVIEANPDLTGAVMSAYQTLTTAKVGTEEYTKAWNDLYQLLQHNASLNILEDNAEAARDAMEVLDDKTASVEERANALQNLNALFGSEIFTDADKGVAALDNLRRALDGDKEAFKQLQEAVLEGILVKYNVGTGEIDLSKFEEGCIYAAALADDVREALIASGLFEIVETEMTVPALEKPEGLEKGDIIDGMVYDGSDDFYSFKEHTVKVQMIKPIGSEIGTRKMGTGSKSSGSKGTKKVASDEKERYHVINKQIEDLSAKYEKAGKIKDQAFGPAKESAALAELGYLDQLIEKEHQYKAEIERDLAKDKSALAEYGATFGEHGEVTNYDALMDKEIAKYNAAIEKAGTNQEAQEAAEKAYDLFIKALETYEGTYSAYLDKLATIQDLQNEKIDKELQNIQDKLDAKLDLEADQLKYLDYLIGKLDDEAFALADALVSLHDKTQPIMNQSDHYAQAWEELKRTAEENGSWTQDMIDKLRELRDGLISTNEEMMELQKTIEEKVNEAISECTDELDKQINRFDTYQSILQNYNDIIDLSGKKFKDYGLMAELSATMVENSINKISGTKDKLDALKSAQAEAQAKLGLAENSGDQETIDYWKRTLEEINIEVENATAEMTSTWKEALQAASDAFESQVNLAIDNFKGGLEAFGDLDMISDSYDRAEKAAERYLEDFEKTYELSQLGRDITKAMNDTTSAFAKDELAELMAEVNEKQKDGVKMSEYDLEVLKKKFELKQAELALEEAQNSMSQIRLTRDNEGNWSYQYTADQDKVDEALSEYEARLYEVAKLSDEYIDEMSKAVIDNQKEMYETLAGLRAEDFASYEEYEAKVREIVNFYTTQDAYLRDELAKAVGDTEYVTATMAVHYNNLSTSFTTVVDTMLGNTGDKTGNLKTWMDSTDNLAKQAEEYFNTKLPEAYKTWEKAVGDAMEAAGTNTEDFKTDVSGYMEDIGDASEELAEDIGDAAKDMQDYIESVMDAVWDWQEEYAAAIREMIAANEALIQSMMAVAAAQGAGGGNEPIADYSREIATLIKNDKYDVDDAYIEELFRQRAEKDKEGKYVKNDRIKNLVAAYDDPSDPKHEDAVKVVDSVLADKGIYFTNEYLAEHGFRTGGYTGAWGPEGKMAFVHEKELILNSDDTVNFLAGVNILREIAKMIDLQAASMAMPHGFTLPMSTSSGGVLEQNVHISASFPGVQDRNEIEIALRSLVNEASQFVLE